MNVGAAKPCLWQRMSDGIKTGINHVQQRVECLGKRYVILTEKACGNNKQLAAIVRLVINLFTTFALSLALTAALPIHPIATALLLNAGEWALRGCSFNKSFYTTTTAFANIILSSLSTIRAGRCSPLEIVFHSILSLSAGYEFYTNLIAHYKEESTTSTSQKPSGC